MAFQNWFKPLHDQPTEREVLAFDIEGAGGPSGFVCGSISGEYLSNFFTDRSEMWNALLEYGARGYWLFAHNLEYDLPILAGEEFFTGKMLFVPGGLLWAEYPAGKRKARFYDSTNLYPRWGVSGLGDIVKLPKLSLPGEIMRRLALGEAWGTFSEDDKRQIERYNRRDAEIVYHAVDMLQSVALRLGGQLRPTIAGVSMDVYRRKFHRYPWLALGSAANNLARPAFYGGRVENFAMGTVEGVNVYDTTSLYPFVQSRARFPHPNHLKLMIAPDPAGRWWEWEGCAAVTVRSPEVFTPLLPARIGERLFFPTGEFSGVWTLTELRQAVLSGYTLLSVEWVFGADVTFNPFEDFVENLFHERLMYQERGEAQANIVKLILNSLYGRFGLNPDGSLQQMVQITPETDFEKLKGYTTETIMNRVVAFGPVESARYPTYANVLIASQIASEARLHLYGELSNQGESAVYCDTDSVLTTGEVATGEGLGSWRMEGERVTADLVAPKEYALHNRALGTEYVVKGVPSYVAEQYLRTGFARFYRALSVREAVAQHKNPAEWVETIKRAGYAIPKRRPQSFDQITSRGWTATEPFQYQELVQMEQSGYRKGWVKALRPKPIYPDVALP